MLTIKQLKEMKEGIFAQGETVDSPAGANSPQFDYGGVKDMGEKVHDREAVKNFFLLLKKVGAGA